MAYLDRSRAERLLAAEGLDALVLLSPESFSYATGAAAGVATMWRKAGAVAVLVPAAANDTETAVVSDLFAPYFRKTSHIADVRESPIWVETSTIAIGEADVQAAKLIGDAWIRDGREAGFNRPETFDASRCYRLLADALADKGLSQARIGVEADALTVSDHVRLSTILRDATLVDASELVARLKMVKVQEEIEHLRRAVTLAEQGMRAIERSIREGITRNELADVWRETIALRPDDNLRTDSWEYISVGSDPWGGNAAVGKHDLIKVDVGCVIDGYTSDSGRTYVFDQATTLQRSLFDALMAGFVAGSSLLKPGTRLDEVHSATLRSIRESGFPAFTRGHFGHGLGAGLGSEQWPFISAHSEVVLEAGMVMAFECPWYVNGLGGMIIENQVLITREGHEMMNTLPVELIEIPA